MKTLKGIIGKKDRACAIGLLEKVKAILETRDSWYHYVCIHLSNVATNEQKVRVSLKLRSTIQKRLGDYSDVIEWLYGECDVHPSLLTSRARIEYRIRWVDSMIAELQ